MPAKRNKQRFNLKKRQQSSQSSDHDSGLSHPPLLRGVLEDQILEHFHRRLLLEDTMLISHLAMRYGLMALILGYSIMMPYQDPEYSFMDGLNEATSIFSLNGTFSEVDPSYYRPGEKDPPSGYVFFFYTITLVVAIFRQQTKYPDIEQGSSRRIFINNGRNRCHDSCPWFRRIAAALLGFAWCVSVIVAMSSTLVKEPTSIFDLSEWRWDLLANLFILSLGFGLLVHRAGVLHHQLRTIWMYLELLTQATTWESDKMLVKTAFLIFSEFLTLGVYIYWKNLVAAIVVPTVWEFSFILCWAGPKSVKEHYWS